MTVITRTIITRATIKALPNTEKKLTPEYDKAFIKVNVVTPAKNAKITMLTTAFTKLLASLLIDFAGRWTYVLKKEKYACNDSATVSNASFSLEAVSPAATLATPATSAASTVFISAEGDVASVAATCPVASCVAASSSTAFSFPVLLSY